MSRRQGVTESAGHRMPPQYVDVCKPTGPARPTLYSPAAADLAAASALEWAMAERESLVVQAPPDDPPLATGGKASPVDSPRDEDLCESSGEEQSAAAALLGLHSAWPSSPDDESRDDDTACCCS